MLIKPNGMPRPSRWHLAVDWAIEGQEAPLLRRWGETAALILLSTARNGQRAP